MGVQQEQNPLEKLAIISITAVVNSDRRYARALQAKQAYQSQFPARPNTNVGAMKGKIVIPQLYEPAKAEKKERNCTVVTKKCGAGLFIDPSRREHGRAKVAFPAPVHRGKYIFCRFSPSLQIGPSYI